MRNFLFSIASLLAALHAAAVAQQSPPQLTLQDCIRLAESVPSPVTIARQERDISARGLTQARAGFLPQSRLINGFTYNSPLQGTRDTFSFIPLNAIREYAFLFTVNQDLDTSGRLRAELARARAAQEQAGVSVGLTQRDLKRAVTAAYFNALLTRRIVRITQVALEESESFEKRTQLLFGGGEAAQADVVKASAQVAFLQQTLNSAQLEAQIAGQELASFWTKDVTAPLSLDDVLEETPAPPDAGTQAGQGEPFLKRLEFSAFNAQIKGLQADVRRARADMLPQLGLTFQYGLDSSAVRIRDRGYAAFVNLNIPVFDWLKARAAMQEARLRTQQVETNRSISERAFSREYQNALARVKQLYQQISLTQRQAKLAEDDLRLSRLRYEGGEGLALDVVTAQNGYAQARTNYYTAMANYLNARADLEVASGR